MEITLYPCLWFDGNAKQAAEFYCSVFGQVKILQDTPLVTTYEIRGTKFMGLNGGPLYKINSSISFYVYCGSEEEVEKLYKIFTEGGNAIMPIGSYNWSKKYAWVVDKFGVNWQLDLDQINSSQKVVPTLLFANEKRDQVKNWLTHCQSIFPNSKILLEAPYGSDAGMPAGTLLFAQQKLSDFILNGMSSTLHHDFDFTPAVSFFIECNDQQEIDYFWEKLGAEGRYSMCGWLEDKFGVSWQVVPIILAKLMADPERSPRVIQAFLKMQKFDIALLLKA
jgi:predicted 3-demethylubiquinone-9 3-methyltransferase (glyoxalase superfamily)